jgi:hypothetical protein
MASNTKSSIKEVDKVINIEEILERLYADYIFNEKISDAGAAITWNTVLLLVELLFNVPKGGLAVDLGSGFSSVVLRAWKKYIDEDLKVISVDTSERWLERTWDFLEAHELDVDDLIIWEEATPRHVSFPPEGRYPDLVIFDIDYTRNRSPYTKEILKGLTSESTVLVVDDMHKAAFRENVVAVLRRDLKSFDIKHWDDIKDDAGRYPSVVTNMVKK